MYTFSPMMLLRLGRCSRDVSHAPAIEPEAVMQKIAPQSAPIEEIAQELKIGL
jgi:hypothetical protein